VNRPATIAECVRHILAGLALVGCAVVSAQPVQAAILHPPRGQDVRRPQQVQAAHLAANLADAPLNGALASQTNLFSGPESADFSINVPGPGDLVVQLSSINVGSWVDADLSLSVNSATGLLETVSGVTGTDLLSPLAVTGPEQLFVNLTGQATGSLDLGLYSVNVVFQPSAVPLPSSAWLLVAGLAGLGGMLRFRTAVPRAA
jgi:hypothetical protein